MTDAVLYFVRAGENEELRFSLRSVEKHLPGVPVFIVGDKPGWVQGVEYRKGNYRVDKPLNVWDNLLIGCLWDQVPEHLVVFNDDMYITEPVTEIPVLYRKSLAAHVASLADRTDWWGKSMRRTAELLPDDALSYELHTPFPCRKSQMRDTMLNVDAGLTPPQWRTMYGNHWHTDPVKHPDVKLTKYHREIGTLPAPFASTNDVTFRWARPYLEALFPHPSRFERW